MSCILNVIVVPCSPIPTKFGIHQIQEWLLGQWSSPAPHYSQCMALFRTWDSQLLLVVKVLKTLFPLLTSAYFEDINMKFMLQELLKRHGARFIYFSMGAYGAKTETLGKIHIRFECAPSPQSHDTHALSLQRWLRKRTVLISTAPWMACDGRHCLDSGTEVGARVGVI